MKEMMVLLLSIVVVVLVSALFPSCSVRRSEAITGKEFRPGKAGIVNGERVFMANCQKCHPAGESGLGPTLNGNPAPGFVKRFQVRHGLGVMPSFKKVEISKQDLHDITTYLHEWKRY